VRRERAGDPVRFTAAEAAQGVDLGTANLVTHHFGLPKVE
jgi:hypothetical protein